MRTTKEFGSLEMVVDLMHGKTAGKADLPDGTEVLNEAKTDWRMPRKPVGGENP